MPCVFFFMGIGTRCLYKISSTEYCLSKSHKFWGSSTIVSKLCTVESRKRYSYPFWFVTSSLVLIVPIEVLSPVKTMVICISFCTVIGSLKIGNTSHNRHENTASCVWSFSTSGSLITGANPSYRSQSRPVWSNLCQLIESKFVLTVYLVLWFLLCCW